MAVSYNLGSTSFWYFADNSGKALVGGYLWSYKQLTPNVLKPIYSDSGGLSPYSNPIPITGNGFVVTQQNLYFADDEAYYLVVTDSPVEGGGTILYQAQNYSAAGSGGGSPPITNYVNLNNLITNGQFLFNASQNVATPITTALTTIAPSNHNGLTTPDIVLRKNSVLSTDSINFVQFNQGDSTPTQSPRYYLEYACTVIGAETQKDIEFPISAHTRTLEGEVTTFSFWARSSTNSTVNVFVRQYFGDGNNSPSPSAISTMQPQVLTTSWVRYNFSVVVPLTNGKTIGNCGNDYLVAVIAAPTSQLFNIDITNVMFFDGALNTEYPYEVQDQTASVLYSPRTGDVKLGFENGVNAAFGWLPMNDGTIGSATSGATRAKIDTFPLYKMLYDNVLDTWAPVSGGRTGDAATDFANNKTLSLTKVLGRALASQGAGAGLTPRVLGQTLGEENHVLTIPEMPSHDHASPPGTGGFFAVQGGGGGLSGAGNVKAFGASSANGGNGAHNNMQPTSFMNVYIKI